MYTDEPYDRIVIEDFTGGLNNTDPPMKLASNEFDTFYNVRLNRKGVVESRPPFRPFTFGTFKDSSIGFTGTGALTTALDGDDNDLVFTAKTYGTSSVTYVKPVTFSESLSVVVTGNDIVVNLATGEDPGNITTTARDIKTAIEALPAAHALVTITHKAENDGSGLVTAMAKAEFSLSWTLTSILDVQITSYQGTSDYAYEGEVYVVSGLVDTTPVIAVWNKTTNKWHKIWQGSAAEGKVDTTVEFLFYKINAALDILIFPNMNPPERWALKTTTLTSLGLAVPVKDTDFTITSLTCTEHLAAGGIEDSDGKTFYYKASYFYDDYNETTQYGESEAVAIGNETLTADTPRKVAILFADKDLPASVSRIIIYRSPANTVAGPYREVGQFSVSDWSAATYTFDDIVPVGFEGGEDVPSGSNPTEEELIIVKPRLVAGAIAGFDKAIPNKLIQCQPGRPDVWNPELFDYLDDDGMAVVDFNRKIYAFTRRGCYQKEGLAEPAYRISNIGCTDGKSVQEIGSGIVWMDYDTVYFADFVQAYGSKGDFPMDIGHRISSVIRQNDKTKPCSSVFFERRYYLLMTDKSDNTRKCFVYDVDWNCWSEYSIPHGIIARSEDTLFSASLYYSKPYIYGHNYQGLTADGIDSVADTLLASVPGQSATQQAATGKWRMACSGLFDITQIYSVGSPILTEDSKTGFRSHFYSYSSGAVGYLATSDDQGAPTYNVSSSEEYIMPEDFAFQFYAKLSAEEVSSYGGIFVSARHASGTTAGDTTFTFSLTRSDTAHVTGINFTVRTVEDSRANASTYSLASSFWPDHTKWALIRAECLRSTQKLRVWINGKLALDYDIPEEHPLPSEETIRIGVEGTAIGSVYLMTGITGSLSGAARDAMMSDFKILEAGGSEAPLEGRDYTDYYGIEEGDSVYFGGNVPVSVQIGRSNLRLSGEYRRTLIGQASLTASAVSSDIKLTLTTSKFSVERNLSEQRSSTDFFPYPFIWGESVLSSLPAGYIADEGPPVVIDWDLISTSVNTEEEFDATATELGFMGVAQGAEWTSYRKINRVVKSLYVDMMLVDNNARDLKLLALVLYVRPLPQQV